MSVSISFSSLSEKNLAGFKKIIHCPLICEVSIIHIINGNGIVLKLRGDVGFGGLFSKRVIFHLSSIRKRLRLEGIFEVVELTCRE